MVPCIGVITLFPQMFDALKQGVTGKALQRQLLTLQLWQLRAFATDDHGTVDDRPYGGGPGMVLMAEPLRAAIKHAEQHWQSRAHRVYLSPQGQRIDQAMLAHWAKASDLPLLMVAGRYRGIDQRVVDSDIDAQWSLGDMVLSGGEIAAMAVIDAVARLIPGALGNEQSARADSFMNGLLDYPHYTRPQQTNEGECVPPVLQSGNHAAIDSWRRQQAQQLTAKYRPDLWQRYQQDQVARSVDQAQGKRSDADTNGSITGERG